MSIARYCQYLHDKGNIAKSLFTPRDPAFERVQFLVTRLDQLNKMRSQENNRLDVSLDKSASRSVHSMLAFIDKQIVKIKETLAEIVKQNEQLNSQVELLTSIDGIGDKTAWAILAYIGDISIRRQLTCPVGDN
jgi:transposase